MFTFSLEAYWYEVNAFFLWNMSLWNKVTFKNTVSETRQNSWFRLLQPKLRTMCLHVYTCLCMFFSPSFILMKIWANPVLGLAQVSQDGYFILIPMLIAKDCLRLFFVHLLVVYNRRIPLIFFHYSTLGNKFQKPSIV